MSSSDIQLEMNFSEKQNRFRSTVESGEFSLLIESGVSALQLPVKEALKQLSTLEEAVTKIDNIPCGLALLDGQSNPGNWSAIEFAAQLSESLRDRHVVYLSGANRDPGEIDRQLAIAANANSANIVAVSGDLGQNIPVRTDSGRIFKRLMEQSFFAGVTVNPYQYDPWALLAQYSKLAARILSNGGFFVTQMGWDTLKLQSLTWYLLSGDLYAPGFARLLFLTPERMKKLLEEDSPGIIIGKELRKTMEHELTLSRKLFDVAQFHRLERQSAACKVLGFSGIQLAGADHPAVAAEAANAVIKGINAFRNFDEFLECYRSDLAESEVNSFHLRFQMFDRVLKRPYPFDDPPRRAELPDPGISFWEKLKVLFAAKDPFAKRRQGIATAGNCPKHNTMGPCGGVRHDGRCENNCQECAYRKWFRFAAAKDALNGIEKEMI